MTLIFSPPTSTVIEDWANPGMGSNTPPARPSPRATAATRSIERYSIVFPLSAGRAVRRESRSV